MIKQIQILSSIIILSIIGLNYSCKKQEDVTIDKIDNGEISFAPMAIGKYWIYEVNNVDADGLITFVGIDSTYIEGTKVIGKNTYFEYRSSSSISYKMYLRDSASYLVDDKGEKFFYHKFDNDTLLNKKTESSGYVINHTYRVIHLLDEKIDCVAGSYPAVEAQYTVSFPLLGTEYTSHYYYSAGIGLILRSDAPNLSGDRKTYSLIRWGGGE